VYYKWLLVDPKDSPYATFRFHYRSWNNLRLLHLTPQNSIRSLIPTSETRHIIVPITSYGCDADSSCSLNAAVNSTRPPEEDVEHEQHTQDSGRCSGFLNSVDPPQRLGPHALHIYKQRQYNTPADLCYPSRSISEDRAPHLRSISEESHAASIAASLLPDIEDDSFSTDDIEIGIATKVALPSEGSGLLSLTSVDNIPSTPESIESMSAPAYQPHPTRQPSPSRTMLWIENSNFSGNPISQHASCSTDFALGEKTQSRLIKGQRESAPYGLISKFETFTIPESVWMKGSLDPSPTPSTPAKRVLKRSQTVPNGIFDG
jgi:hypothetical protein